MKIAILANLKANAPSIPGVPASTWDDLDSPATVEAIGAALAAGGHESTFLEANAAEPHDLVGRLLDYKPELCFNIAEGHFGDGREAQVPGILEMLRIPYTGSRVLTLALCLDKPMTKRLLSYHELPTPEFQVFGAPDEEVNDDLADGDDLRFPLFLKPSREGTGIGVSSSSIVETMGELRSELDRQLKEYRQPILCERFIDGRELTVGILGNLAPTAARRLNERTAPAVMPEELTIFPVLEVRTGDYDPEERGLYSNRVKTELVHDFRYACPAPLPEDLSDRLKGLAAAVFRVTGCQDVGRIDFRIDADGNPYILEINPLPGLNPEYSDLCLEAYASEWSYEQLINGIVDAAKERIR
jgi:D-alanine-D-alanine ligase